MGGPGSENFDIDEQGNITLKQELNFEETETYKLNVFTFFGEKSVTNELIFNVIDIDEEPDINLSFISSSLSEDIATNTKFAEIEVLDPEQNGIDISVSGKDKEKVTVSNSGDLTLSQSLDYEQKKDLEFVINVFDGKNTVSAPVKIKVDNVNDLNTSINLSGSSIHEGSSIDTVVGNISANENSSLSYSLSGDNSDDFTISSDGKIKVNRSLDYSSKGSYNLTLTVTGQNDQVNVPLNINIAENINPNFETTCLNSCSLLETSSIGTVVINSSRTDTDSDEITYSLKNDFSNKFTIDSNSGEVKLNKSLDYEEVASYNLEVIATDSKGASKEQISSFSVEDYTYTLLDKASSSDNVKKGSYGNNVRHLFVESDLSTLSPQDRIIANYGVNVAGTSYSLSGTDADKAEIDSDGILRLKSNLNWSLDETNINGTIPLYTFNVNADIPGENTVSKQVYFSPKNVEKNENLVMKFASGFNNIEHSVTGSNPFQPELVVTIAELVELTIKL